jgi:hypothetical protein
MNDENGLSVGKEEKAIDAAIAAIQRGGNVGHSLCCIGLGAAIDGSESLQNCVECERWFTISAGQGRSDKAYCSNACRMQAYRKRKAKQ